MNKFFVKLIKYPSLILILITHLSCGEVELGLDRLFQEPFYHLLTGKNVAILTNESATDCHGVESLEILLKNQKRFDYRVIAAFAPEHGLDGKKNAFENFGDHKISDLPIYSLHGKTKRPTEEMLKGVEVVIYDIQNIGVRCYTYETTMRYLMEELAKRKIEMIILDRPNPRGGTFVEGLGVEERFRCFFSYNDVPFCHGMTNGELANYLNYEHKINCILKTVPMKGWQRWMCYEDTKLPWKKPSPNIPDWETTLIYPSTVVLGESLEIVSIDLRGKNPFKLVGAPWIDGQDFVEALNSLNLPGVLFTYKHFVPIWGKYVGEKCEGANIRVIDPGSYQALKVQYALVDTLIKMYPQHFEEHLNCARKNGRFKTCNYITGNEKLIDCLTQKKSLREELSDIENFYIKDFLKRRSKYLLY